MGRVICSPGCASHEVREALGQGPRAATQPGTTSSAGQPAVHPQQEGAGRSRTPLCTQQPRGVPGCGFLAWWHTVTERECHQPLSNRALHLFTKLDQPWGVLGVKGQRGGLQGGRGRREAPAGASRRRTPRPRCCLLVPYPAPLGCCCLWLSNITAEIHLPLKCQHLITASEPFSFLLPSKSRFHPWSSREALVYG